MQIGRFRITRRLLLISIALKLLTSAGGLYFFKDRFGLTPGTLAVRCLNSGAVPATSGARDFVLLGLGPAEIEITSRVPLLRFLLDLDEGAPSSLFIAGGALGERLFRPDGSVVFEVVPGRPEIKRVGLLRRELYHYRMKLDLPPDSKGPVAFSVRDGDPARSPRKSPEAS